MRLLESLAYKLVSFKENSRNLTTGNATMQLYTMKYRKYPLLIAISNFNFKAKVREMIFDNEKDQVQYKSAWNKEHANSLIIENTVLSLNKEDAELIDALFNFGQALDPHGSRVMQLLRAIHKDGIDIGLDMGFNNQCGLIQQEMDRIFEACDSHHKAERSEKLTPSLHHMFASEEELTLLKKTLPSTKFNNIHIKCPHCYIHYKKLLKQYGGGTIISDVCDELTYI